MQVIHKITSNERIKTIQLPAFAPVVTNNSRCQPIPYKSPAEIAATTIPVNKKGFQSFLIPLKKDLTLTVSPHMIPLEQWNKPAKPTNAMIIEPIKAGNIILIHHIIVEQEVQIVMVVNLMLLQMK